MTDDDKSNEYQYLTFSLSIRMTYDIMTIAIITIGKQRNKKRIELNKIRKIFVFFEKCCFICFNINCEAQLLNDFLNLSGFCCRYTRHAGCSSLRCYKYWTNFESNDILQTQLQQQQPPTTETTTRRNLPQTFSEISIWRCFDQHF